MHFLSSVGAAGWRETRGKPSTSTTPFVDVNFALRATITSPVEVEDLRHFVTEMQDLDA